MLERLKQIETRYEDLSRELSSPELLADHSAYSKAAKQHRALRDIVEKNRAGNVLKEERGRTRTSGTAMTTKCERWRVLKLRISKRTRVDRNGAEGAADSV